MWLRVIKRISEAYNFKVGGKICKYFHGINFWICWIRNIQKFKNKQTVWDKQVHVGMINMQRLLFFRCNVYTSSQTYYDVLEIGRQADKKEIKKAYIKLCRKVSIEREINEVFLILAH